MRRDRLYRIGGRAHFHGITFESVIARVRATDNGRDTVKRFSAGTHQLIGKLKKMPLLRVFPAFGRIGTLFFVVFIALLLIDIVFPDFFAIDGQGTLVYTLLAVGAVLVLIAIVLARKPIKRLLQYHGAEHMAINTYRQGKALTTENIARANRATPSCGSLFVLVFLIVSVPLMFIPNSDYLLIIVFCVTFELTMLARRVKWLGWLLRFGMWTQRKVFTRKPDASQIEVARRGLYALINIINEENAKRAAPDRHS
jgi:uncharacterized protein YqhQ